MGKGSGMVTYISGPVRGTTDYVDRFAAAHIQLASRGYIPVSPLDNGHQDLGDENEDEQAYLAYLKRDIRTLLECDQVYMLRGWESSRGARLEKLIAEGLGMPVMFQDGEGGGKDGTV